MVVGGGSIWGNKQQVRLVENWNSVGTLGSLPGGVVLDSKKLQQLKKRS